MKKKQRINAIFLVIGFIMCMMNLFQTVSAAQTTSITLNCIDEKQHMILSDMHWNLYFVGTLEGDKFVYSDSFSSCQDTVMMEDMSTSELTDFASTLRNYTLKDKITPLQTGVTGADGQLTFSGLQSGMYLLTAEKLKIDVRSWKAIPSIITVDASKENNIVSMAKVRDATMDEQETDYTVRKVWMNDEEQLQVRSARITVDIYRNGEFFKPVVLDEKTNWEYSWKDTTGAEWFVIEEEIPRYYTVKYRDNVTEYLVVNTLQPQYRSGSIIGQEETTTTPTTLPDSWITGVEDTDTTPSFTTDSNSETSTTVPAGYYTETTADTHRSSSDIETSTTNETDSSLTDISSSTGGSSRVTSATTKTTVTTTRTSSGTSKSNSGSGSGGSDSSGNTVQIAKLPQTGQLWWPVVPLTCGGLLMISIGMRLGKKDDE